MTELKHCRKCDCDKPADREHWYFQKGRPHGAVCKICRRDNLYQNRNSNIEAVREKQREWRKRNIESVRERERETTRQRYKNDPNYRDLLRRSCRKRRQDPDVRERQRVSARQRRRDNLDAVREKQRNYVRQRRETDPKFRLNQSVRGAIWQSLKRRGAKKTKSKVYLLDWTIEDLMTHLESLFEEGMTFENYGKWEIDHIVPLSAVSYESEHDQLFKLVWALGNLAPLWKSDNNSKLAQVNWQLPDTYKNPKLRAMYENRNYALVTKDAA